MYGKQRLFIALTRELRILEQQQHSVITHHNTTHSHKTHTKAFRERFLNNDSGQGKVLPNKQTNSIYHSKREKKSK